MDRISCSLGRISGGFHNAFYLDVRQGLSSHKINAELSSGGSRGDYPSRVGWGGNQEARIPSGKTVQTQSHFILCLQGPSFPPPAVVELGAAPEDHTLALGGHTSQPPFHVSMGSVGHWKHFINDLGSQFEKNIFSLKTIELYT